LAPFSTCRIGPKMGRKQGCNNPNFWENRNK
jgi:hypothetical protein